MPGISTWKSGKLIEPQRIGFVSTRLAGTDGVSLETAKWVQVLEQDQHQCFSYAGRLDRDAEMSMCVPEAFFNHPENAWINERIWGRTVRDPLVTRRIYALADYLKSTLMDFVRRFDLRLLIFENVLSIPMHVPLGVALAHLLSETHLPAIAHHHDFYWERSRFSINAVNDLLDMAFPPRDPDMLHVVINQAAQEELARRKGVPALIVPNVLDFEHPPSPPDAYASDVRTEMGLGPDDVILLQPTRVVPRKRIEQAIELVRWLGDSRYKLVVSHEAGDEGADYLHMLQAHAERLGVDLRFFATRVSEVRQLNVEGQKTYTLWDLYPHAALVTYPSMYEGFGNALLEAIYFRKPLLVNRYSIFHRDIEPRGFRVAVMDGYLTESVVQEVRHILEDKDYRNQMVEHNYQVAAQFFSYAELRRQLRTLLISLASLYPES